MPEVKRRRGLFLPTALEGSVHGQLALLLLSEVSRKSWPWVCVAEARAYLMVEREWSTKEQEQESKSTPPAPCEVAENKIYLQDIPPLTSFFHLGQLLSNNAIKF
jgi:hypothetical protein